MSSASSIHQLLIDEVDALLRGQAVDPILLDVLDLDQAPTDEEQILIERFNQLVEKLGELNTFANDLGNGKLDCETPRRNVLVSPLKQLHANLRHMAWQTKQVAQGDFNQQVNFLGDFAESFNSMIQSLREKSIAEADLKKSERQYRVVFDKSPLGMAHVNRYGEFLLVNRAFAKLVDYPEESLLEMGIAGITPYDHLQSSHEMVQRLFHEKADSLTYDIQFLPRGKEPIWVRINSTIIRDEHRKIPYVLSIIQDINQQKLLEQQIQDHNRLLENLVESRTTELTEAKEHAEKADRVKSEFLANMSHEMRTPINGIIGMAELGMHAEMKPAEAFVGVLQESQALLSLVNRILDLSKIEAQQVQIESIPFNLATIFDDLITFFKPIALRRGIDLTIQTNDQFPSRVLGDPLRFRQVLVHLVENAIKFTHEGGVTVRVTSLFQDDIHCHLRFVVEDTGIGIPENRLKDIFRDFTQLDSKNTRKYGGTGLGLSIAQRVLQLMGTEIHVESEFGRGSSFSFDIEMDIPSTRDQEPEWTSPMVVASSLNLPDLIHLNEAKKSTALEVNMNKDSDSDAKPRVLVVEDYEANWMILMAHLKHLGYQSELAENGKEAVECFRQKDYDIVLMDIQMPEMNGLEATKIIREIEHERIGGPHIPIIAVTANTTDEDRKNCVEAGLDDFIAKPLSRDILVEKMGQWLSAES